MSQEIQEQLHKQQEVIADKQMSVKEDLDKVEPAVIEAQNGTCVLAQVCFPEGMLSPCSWRVQGSEHGFRQVPGVCACKSLPADIQRLLVHLRAVCSS